MDDFGDFEGVGEDLAGPLIGGGAAQVGMLATKMLFKGKPITKWAGLIGTLLGGGISAGLMFSPRYRRMGIQGLATAALVGIPRQIEDMVMGGPMQGYLGVITPEQELAGYFGANTGVPAGDVQLLDSGSGSTGMFGTVVPEQDMSGAGGVPDVELLGAFGSNFLS
jgi:hypothetical protein